MASSSQKRVLVLCIDLDDDLGQKTGISSPVMGREKVLSAGIRLGLVDPEESDSNAIFASVKTYDLIQSRGDAAEVAIVTGSKQGEPFSSSTLLDQVSKVSQTVQPTDVYVVTDGFGDEDIVPVLKLKLPLSGIVRVVVKHSKTVEESYVVVGRYLRMLFTDQRFKRYSLGFTGFSLMILSALAFIGYLNYALLIISMVLGLTAFVKGMSLDRFVIDRIRSVFSLPMPAYLLSIRILAFIAGYGLFVVGGTLGVYGAFNALVQLGITDPLTALLKLNVLGGEFLRSSSLYFLTGGIALQLGRATAFFVGDWAESRGLIVSIAVMASLYPLALVMGDFLIDPNRFLQTTVAAALTSALLSVVSYAVLAGVHLLLEKHLRRQRDASS